MSNRFNVSEKDAWNDKTYMELAEWLSNYPNFILKKHFESYGEGKLLKKWRPSNGIAKIFDVGCSTGEFYRYIHNYRHDLDYKGFDISELPIQRAKQKFPNGDFHKLISGIDEIENNIGQPEAVWCRDVVMHQKDPYLFLNKLIDLAKEALFIRLRTRDVGDTEFNSNISCQMHWGNWVPYIVLNIEELIGRIETNQNIKSLVIHRAYNVLGGHSHRFLPKELYFPSTGTAETALFIKKGLRGNAPLDVKYQDFSNLEYVQLNTFSQRVIRKVSTGIYKLYKKYFK